MKEWVCGGLGVWWSLVTMLVRMVLDFPGKFPLVHKRPILACVSPCVLLFFYSIIMRTIHELSLCIFQKF